MVLCFVWVAAKFWLGVFLIFGGALVERKVAVVSSFGSFPPRSPARDEVTLPARFCAATAVEYICGAIVIALDDKLREY